jgi:aspartate ammonia-lyase
MMAPALREEDDSIGRIGVPSDALWGAQTERARRNFQISGIKITKFPALICALAMTKLACARANAQIGALANWKLVAIEEACRAVIAGRHDADFPLDYLQGGAGTSLNMNANEVIANLANEHLGGRLGDYRPVHPNDDVNASQSTNDVYPTSVRLSLLLAHTELEKALIGLADAFEERGEAFRDVMKLGRTQLQDAVPMTLGQEFAAFATALREDVVRLREMTKLVSEVNIGGTAIGTGLNAPKGYAQLAIRELSAISGHELVPAANLIEASWDMGAFVLFSGMLKRLAVKLSKIANDLRLLSSGPRGGLREIVLPALQPGSSIMPGKINPVMPEAVNQAAFQVIGNDLAITLAAEAGQLQLNAMEPLIAGNLHMSMQILENVMRAFAETCVRGIAPDPAGCWQHLDSSTGMATVLVPIVGYRKSAEVAKIALASGRRVADIAVELGLIPADSAAEIFDSRPAAGDPAR